MTKRIFRSICLVAILVFLASAVFIMGALYSYFSSMQQKQLRLETGLAAQGVINAGSGYFEGLNPSDYRITWIGSDGTVLYDSQSSAEEMENHLEREEVRLAIEKGYGESSRYSTTLMEKLLYSAQKLPDGTIIRLAETQHSVLTLLLGMLQPILVVAIFAVILSLVLASGLSKKIVKPLNELNLDAPLSSEGYDEISPLLRRIDKQQKQLRAQSDELQRKRDEFEAVTGNMKDGLILLDVKGRILSINRSAAKLLDTDSRCIGKDILTVNRTLEMQELLRKAQGGIKAEKVMTIGSGKYQLDVSPVDSENEITGYVILLFDVTEKEQAEQMRREFTANVSHELKTPLHSISGCAELLNNDMVKPEDVKQFTGQIYMEAQRMIRLVDDIIGLSHLDEGADDMKRETIDLYTTAENTIKSLSTEATAANITVTLSGESAKLSGIPQLIGGIVYNLCDNAIKYNRKDGSVSIDVHTEDNYAVLTVSDTGIGIPPEHQSRIFERFYRVDKSHSKEVGGTGLGLSIVKHAAQIHSAQIDLHSTPNKGTTITVRFPKEGNTEGR